MDTRLQENANHSFLIGLVTGGVIGAGLAILFAPRLASELRQRLTDSATDLGNAASQKYHDVTTRVADVWMRSPQEGRQSATTWPMRSAAARARSSSLRWPRRQAARNDRERRARL